jgi:hypothetical protein
VDVYLAGQIKAKATIKRNRDNRMEDYLFLRQLKVRNAEIRRRIGVSQRTLERYRKLLRERGYVVP